MSVSSPFKKSQDEMKLDFHNACLENSRKYRMLELSYSQKEFKRKYSWCLSRENTPTSNKLSRGGKSRNNSKRNIDGVGDKIKSSSLDKNSSKSQPRLPQSTTTTLTTFASDTSDRPSYFTATSSESQTVVSSACSENTSMAQGDFPGVLNRRRTSVLDVDTEDRIDYLQNLWNRVFPVDNGIFSSSKHGERGQNMASRDVFTSLVMNQFKYRGTDTQSTKLPSIADRKQQPEQVIPDTNISKLKIATQSSVENIFPKVPDDKDDMVEYEERPSLCSSVGSDDSQKDNAEDDTRLKDNTLNATNGNVRRKSMNIQLLKPPFQNFVGRSRSLSMDSSLAEGMWRSSIFNVLMRSTRRKRFQNCVMVAVNKGRVNNLQGRKWRAEMRKCRYLRVPDDSPPPSPVNSEPDSLDF